MLNTNCNECANKKNVQFFLIIIIIIIINNLYSAKIQKFSGASQSMRNIIKNILIKNIYKINENKKINKLNKFKTNKSLGSF